MEQCRICRFPCRSVRRSPGGARFEVDCVRCGQYAIITEATTNSLIEERRFTAIQVANLSGYIRQNPGFVILERDLERLRNLQTPSVDEKAANLLIGLGKEFPQPGRSISIDCKRLDVDLDLTASVRASDGMYPDDSFPDLACQASKWMSIASATSPEELRYLLKDFLEGQRFVAEKLAGAFVITPKGWQHIADLRRTQSKSTKAFVAMSFAPISTGFLLTRWNLV